MSLRRKITNLPVEACAGAIREKMTSNPVLFLSAEPGAGKSTIVPLELLDAPFRNGKKIIMLEPRRVAARAVAARMAYLLGEPTGETVGYRTGLESKCGKNTVIEIVTEAILTRMLQSDPELPDVSVVIFDEFHERSIHADLGLTLALDVCETLRTDLRILVMSATLDLPTLQRIIPNAGRLHIPGKVFPVQTIYTDTAAEQTLERRMALTISNALESFPGDLLAFLPGVREIHLTAEHLSGLTDAEVLPLYGDLSAAEQDKVFSPKKNAGIRRVVLATSIAETSLTVEGVRIVVDSGWTRLPQFSPATGMNRLETVRISLAGAEQRRGRAGRTEEGVCIRLWRPFEEKSFLPYRTPEILETDLCELMLELLNWGITPDTVSQLHFPDLPPESHLLQAFDFLKKIGAVQNDNRISEYGKRLLAIPVHPRIGHCIQKASQLGNPDDALTFAAILSEPHFLDHDSVDLTLRFSALSNPRGYRVDPAALKRIRMTRERLCARTKSCKITHTEDPVPLGITAAFAYPDRFAVKKKQSDNEFILANGVTAEVDRNDVLSHASFLAVIETTTINGRTKIRLAAAVEPSEIDRYLSELVSIRQELIWDSEDKSVRARELKAIGAVILSSKVRTDIPQERLLPVFLDGIRKTGFHALELSKNELAFCQRVTFLNRNGYSEYPDFSEEGLMNTLDTWLAPYVSGFKRIDDLRKLNFGSILAGCIPVKAHYAMNELAPEKIEVPSGSNIRINYADPHQPKAAVRLQELFGMKSTPKLAGGKVPLLMDILSPAMRTVQITADLESFWKDSYFLVRKDMRGRYPKHDWPEDPANAVAHRSVRAPKKP